MCAKLLGVLLFACQIIFNRSRVIHEATGDISVINVTPKPALASSNLPEGYVRFPDLHAAYKVYDESIEWVAARDRCIAEGAHLAIADTVEKIERIYAMQSEVHDWISVGIHKPENFDEWVRVDNSLPLNSLPWQRHNPDEDGTCVAISFSGDALVNCECDTSNWYVCEIPI